MSVDIDHLGVSRNPLRSDKVRLEAWVRYEVRKWMEAHIERGLPMSEMPRRTQYCPEMGDRIFALIEARLDFRAISRKALPAGQAGPI